MSLKKKKRTKKQATVDTLKRYGQIFSKRLIKNITSWEQKYKNFLDVNGYSYIFQHPIICGEKKLYILDFYFPELNVAIEIDGFKYHSSKEAIKSDNLRTRRLKKEGIIVRRLTNRQVDTLGDKMLLQITKIFLQNARI